MAKGHLQATGLDARGRKQYRYYADWRAARDGTKFHNMAEFGACLPAIRRSVTKALASNDLSRARVIAAGAFQTAAWQRGKTVKGLHKTESILWHWLEKQYG